MSGSILLITLLGHLAAAAYATDRDKPWLGTWLSTDRSENWQAFVDAADLGLPTEFSGLFKLQHRFWKTDGDLYHHELTIPSRNFKKPEAFRLGPDAREVQVTFNGQAIKLHHSEVGDKLVIDMEFTATGKHVIDTYQVTGSRGDRLIKSFKIGDVEGKRWFKRIE